MKRLVCLAAAIIGVGPAIAEPLTEAERQALIDQLDTLKDTARSNVLGRFKGAREAYQAGMANPEAAVELYIKCVEKVDYIDKERKSSDFRDWKKRNKDRLDDENFALALREQLRWTLLTMDAAADPEKTHELADRMLSILDSIYARPEDLARHVGVLKNSVTNTVFTRTYELSGYKIQDWPMSPITENGRGRIQIDEPFEFVIFPALEKKKDFEKLREAWAKRIRYEEVARGFWAPGSRGVENGNSPERETFLSERKPELIWESEEYLFKAGDQRKAAFNMLNHLRENISHSSARDWEDRFRKLVVLPAEIGAAG